MKRKSESREEWWRRARTASVRIPRSRRSWHSSRGRPGRRRAAARQAAFVHEQLAPRRPRWQSPDAGGSRLECAVDHRSAGRDRPAADLLRPLFIVPWLARRGEATPAISLSFRSITDAGTTRDRVVLLRGRRALFWCRPYSAVRQRTTTRRPVASLGIDLARVLPYNLARTWHLQLGLFWVVASFLAAGIFLAPVIAGSEPRGQRLLTFALLARPGRCGRGQSRR